MKEHIVIIGFGWVGQANAVALSEMGYDVSYFDIIQPSLHYNDTHGGAYERMHKLSTPLEADGPETVYMVCVGDRVTVDGEQDISAVIKAMEPLKTAQGKVMLRSTILAHNLPKLSFQYYVPEFLHEKYAVEECLKPPFFVLGVSEEMSQEARPSFLHAWEASAEKRFVGTPAQASYIKYLSNIWNSLRIAFVNEFGDAMIGHVGPKQQQAIEEVIDFMFEKQSYLRYGKSYGGYCLPKDILTFFATHRTEGKNVALITGVHESNLAHKAIERAFEELPVWYSRWVNDEGKRA